MRALIAAGLAFIALASSARAASFPAEQIERGRQLAVAGDCAACHTAPGGGAAFAGGNAIPSPLGMIYGANITPSKAQGIGSYSEAQFARALREGIRGDGAHLYPAMPYSAYTGLSDTDVEALYAYFMQDVAPVDYAPPRTRLPFPFNLRFSMMVWNALFLKDRRFESDPSRSAQWNRGAYLVGVLEHCSACHSPRGFLMQEEKGSAFAGGPLGEWYAPNITSDPISGVGGWSQVELVAYLKLGRVPGKARAAGGMAEAVTHSLSHLPDTDLEAIAAYLGSVAPVRNAGPMRPAFDWGAPAMFEAGLRGAAPAKVQGGAALYSGLCASCHGSTGVGTRDQAYPSLFRNSTVGDARPNNLIAVILEGVNRDAGGERAFMPNFGPRSFVQSLSDAQVAVLATYVRTTFGPGGAPIIPADVAEARRGGTVSPLLWLARIGIGAGVLIVLAVLAWVGMGLRRGHGARQ